MPFDKLTSQRLTRHEKFCLRRLSDLSFIKLIGIHDGFENVTVLFFEIVSGNVVFLQISQQGLFLVLTTRQTFDNYRRFPNYSFILLNCIRRRFLLKGFLFILLNCTRKPCRLKGLLLANLFYMNERNHEVANYVSLLCNSYLNRLLNDANQLCKISPHSLLLVLVTRQTFENYYRFRNCIDDWTYTMSVHFNSIIETIKSKICKLHLPKPLI